MVVSVWCLKSRNIMLFVCNSNIFHNESIHFSNESIFGSGVSCKYHDFHYYWISYRNPRNFQKIENPPDPEIDLCHWINRRIRYGKYSNWKQTTLYLCFLDIILTLPSLPTHSLRAKVCLETRGFSKFWKFRVFYIGNPTVMEINGKWGYFQENLVKHLAMIPVGLRHCYRRSRPGSTRGPQVAHSPGSRGGSPQIRHLSF